MGSYRTRIDAAAYKKSPVLGDFADLHRGLANGDYVSGPLSYDFTDT